MKSITRRFVVATGIISMVLATFIGLEFDSKHVLASESWGEKADISQKSLFNHYWNIETNMFNHQYPNDESDEGFHYWWQAHAIDTLIDAYERTGNDEYIDQAMTLYNSVLQKNDGDIRNHFYDDMQWMALALFRLYENTGDETYENAVFTLWEDIKHGWKEDLGGGIAWNKDYEYFSNVSNAPAAILAARLYQRYGDEEDLEWATKIYGWENSTLVDQETGLVWDGIGADGDLNKDEYTYSQGVYIGASVELYRVTEDAKYMEQAIQTAETMTEQFTNDNQIIDEDDSGDGGLFKGILIRYLAEIVKEDPSQNQLADFIMRNAESAWQQTESEEKIFFGSSWLNTPSYPVDLSQHLSGVMLMEQAALLEHHITVDDIMALVEQYEQEGAFTNEEVPHALKVHLTAISHYENQEATGKRINHMGGFKDLLDHQLDNALISKEAFDDLNVQVDALIEQWH